MNMHTFRLFLYSLLILAAGFWGSCSVAGEVIFSDDFSSGTVDLDKWKLDVRTDMGCSVDIEDGQLKAYFDGKNVITLQAYAIAKPIRLPENWLRIKISGIWKITAKSTGEFIIRLFDAQNPAAYVQGTYGTWTTYPWDHFRVIDSGGTYNLFARDFPTTYKAFAISITPDGWTFTENGEILGSVVGNPIANAQAIQFRIGGEDYSSDGAETIYFDDVEVTADVEGNFAWGQGVGWINFSPALSEPEVGLYVDDKILSGYIWAENIGWINLCPKIDHPDVGIKNDGTGFLTGHAWGENVGWIDFNPTVAGDSNHYGVTIDGQGRFEGWAWGQSIGWIHLRAGSAIPYGVSTDWSTSLTVNNDDLAELAWQWEQQGTLAADLNGDSVVDMVDMSILAGYWLDKVPPGWPLGH